MVTSQTLSRPAIKVRPLCFILSSKAHLGVSVLRIYPDDVDALSTKLFLLLQVDQYQPALTVIDGHKDKSKLAFERAYTLYRSHEDTEAHEIIRSLKEQNADDRGLAHLEAQLVCIYCHIAHDGELEKRYS